MIVKLKTIEIFHFILLFFFFSVNSLYSQTGEAKSLEIGNKWFYSYSNMIGGSGSYYQEVIGDTMIQSKQYAIILDSRITTSYRFQRADSSKIFRYFPDFMQEYILVNFNTPDTVGFNYTISNDTIFFWNSWRARQCRYDDDGLEETIECYIKGIGLNHYTSIGSNGSNHNLIAGIIEGEFYGDSTVLGIEQFNEQNNRGFALYQNYPNPFNPTTKIVYKIEESNFIQLKLFNVLGQTIITLINEYKTSGLYEIEFNGKDLPSGVYYYQLRSRSRIKTKKMLLLK